VPAGPDPAAMELAAKIGKNVASPVMVFAYPGGASTYAGPVPFHVVHADSKTKKVSIIVGENVPSDAHTSFLVTATREGSSFSVFTCSVGSWDALTKIDLDMTPVELKQDDVLSCLVSGPGAATLPALLLLLEADIG